MQVGGPPPLLAAAISTAQDIGQLPRLTSPPFPPFPFLSSPFLLQTIIAAARMKEEGKVRKVIVTGCLAQRYSEELAAQLPEADLVMG